MFRSKKPNTEFVSLYHSKDWANAGAEIDRLGRQLDAVRQSKKAAKRNSWAKKHWTQTEQILLRKWKQTIRLQNVGLRQSVLAKPRPNIDYSWWEPSYEPGVSMPLFDNLTRWVVEKTETVNLTRAWEMAKEEKLQKARQGLA